MEQNRRVSVISRHLNPNQVLSDNNTALALTTQECASKVPHYEVPVKKRKIQEFKSVIEDDSSDVGQNMPREKERLLKWNGWGYKDTEFLMHKNGDVYVKGSRYPILSGKILPDFRNYIEKYCGVNVEEQSPPQTLAQMKAKIHRPRLCEEYLKELEKTKPYKYISFDDECRLLHSRGHCLQEIYQLRWGYFKRLVDAVIYPSCHEDVERIVALAQKYPVAIIPFGGGTTVSQALMCPENEDRMIISVDMQEMNRVKWVDFENNTACIEAGAVGVDIHEQLSKQGVTLGHEPDSFEMSTLGGWVSTRCSGMKKNVTGNIEDFVIKIKMVTSLGTIDTIGNGHQRKSHGLDLHQLMFGHEGTLGIVTECVVKIYKLPAVEKYGSVVFPDYESGVKALKEIQDRKWAPASIRLLDNTQFQMGSALKVKAESFIEPMEEWLKKTLLTKVKGFDLEKMCAMTLLFEGQTKEEVATQEKRVYSITKKYGGLEGGEKGGRQGYMLTYVIAYLRDIMMAYWYVAESFESFVPWKDVVKCTERVYERITQSCKQRGVPTKPWICARVSQIYDTGVCLYFYFGFVFKGLSDPVKVFSEIEAEARDEILANNGSLSHHHGVGKLRRKWMPAVNGALGVDILKKIKKEIDPNNTFCSGNMQLTPATITFPPGDWTSIEQRKKM